jgi:hypothetical protein
VVEEVVSFFEKRKSESEFKLILISFANKVKELEK